MDHVRHKVKYSPGVLFNHNGMNDGEFRSVRQHHPCKQGPLRTIVMIMGVRVCMAMSVTVSKVIVMVIVVMIMVMIMVVRR